MNHAVTCARRMPDEVEMQLEVSNAPKTTPAWLGEHVNDVYPLLLTAVRDV